MASTRKTAVSTTSPKKKLSAKASPKAHTSREAIVAAAIEVFAERGFDGSTLRDVAERSGVKQPLIVYHFGDKETLFRAAVDSTWASVERSARDCATLASQELDGRPDSVTTRDRLRTVLRSIVEAAAAQPAYLRILLREASHDSPRFEWLANHHMDRNFRDAVRLIEAAQSTHVLPDTSPKHLVYVLIGALTFPLAAAADVRRQVGTSPSDARYLDAHVDALMAFLAPTRREPRATKRGHTRT